MKFLLDTHLLLWTVSQSRRLSPKARELIGDPGNELLFSIASLWEAAIKRSLHRADFQVDLRLLRCGLLDHGFEQLSITAEHTLAVAKPAAAASGPVRPDAGRAKRDRGDYPADRRSGRRAISGAGAQSMREGG